MEGGEAAGLKLIFPQNPDFVSGSTEPPIQRCVVQHLRPGDVFYDIGANVGFFSVLASRCVGSGGSVYAFEPVAANADAIRKNASLNAFAHLVVFEVAVDASSGSRELFVTEWDGGASLSRDAVAPLERVWPRVVPVVALDDIVQAKRLRPPTLIKIDVEGAETRVVSGMQRMIATFKPILVYEVDDSDKAAFTRRWDALDRFVTSLGYHVTHLEDSYPNTSWFVGHSIARPIQP